MNLQSSSPSLARFLTVLILGVPGLFAVACLDVITGTEMTFSLFYLLPIIGMTWFGGGRFTPLFALLASMVWFAADWKSGVEYHHAATPYWNALIRTGYFLISCLLLDRLKTALEKEHANARCDPLTGIANYRYFFELGERELQRAQRYHRSVTIACLDIDGFKAINDRLGHQGGNQLLHQMAQTLRLGLRGTDLAARVGGDEFVVLFPETSGEGANTALSRLQQALRELTGLGREEITVSIGSATFPDPTHTLEEMIRRADRLLFSAKAEGKNCMKQEIVPQKEIVRRPR